MKILRYSESQIMAILKQTERGVLVPELCREHGMSRAAFYQWRSKFGDMDASIVSEMKTMAEENRRLKKVRRAEYAEQFAQGGARKKK